MRILFLLILISFCLSFKSSAQDSLASRYRRQTVRLYAQGGGYSTSVDAFDPSKGGRSYFKDKGIFYPSFGAGAIIEAKVDKPRFYMGAGVSFSSFDFGGERYVQILSPQQEESWIYDGTNKVFNIELFAGYYIWLNDQIALKPQLGLAVSSINTRFEWDVYQYQTTNLKRSADLSRSQLKLAGRGSLFLSFKKRFEAGIDFIGMPAAELGITHSVKFNSVGAVVRYIHSF